MDVVGLLKSSYSDYATIITDWTFALFSEKIKDNVMINCIQLLSSIIN